MCIISYKPKGVDTTVEKLKQYNINGFNSNSQGSGYAIKYEPGFLRFKKGFFDINEFNESLIYDLRNVEFEDVEIVLHHRIGTAGNIDKKNCHPYIYSTKDKETLQADSIDKALFFHNGMVHTPFIDFDMSDTYNLMYNYVCIEQQNPEVITNPDMFVCNFEEFLLSNINPKSNWSKFVVMYPDEKRTYTQGSFINEEGWMMSNQGYKRAPVYSNKSGYKLEDLIKR